MGILNITPDSFSDGGRYDALDRAVAHGLAMAGQGADIIDIGGESTRPGSSRVSAAEQCRRVREVIRQLRIDLPKSVSISIDTTLASVAESAIASGAVMINDISAGRDDSKMFNLVAEVGVEMVLMHMQGEPKSMQDNPRYDNAVDEVAAFLSDRLQAAQSAGIAVESLLIDPGIGFGKRRQHNLALLANLPQFVALGARVVLGASRKRFMGSLCNIDQPLKLLPATIATTALGVWAGVTVFRVHEVAENRQAADVTWAIRDADRLLD